MSNKTETTTEEPTVQKIFVLGKNLLQYEREDLFEGWVANPEYEVIALKEAGFRWRGALIPFELWTEIVLFLKWSQTTYKDEAMVTLFYNPTEAKWAAWAFPQRGMGMTVNLLPDDPEFLTDRKRFSGDWIQAGSVHHHCESSAFQSGTDSDDECDRDGIHITVGKVSSLNVDLHFRQVWGSRMTVVPDDQIDSWIARPLWAQQVPDHYFANISKAVYGDIPVPKKGEPIGFPEEWKSRLRQSDRSRYTGGYGRHSSFQNPTLLNRNTSSKATGGNTGDTKTEELSPGRLELLGKLQSWVKETAEQLKSSTSYLARLSLMGEDELKDSPQSIKNDYILFQDALSTCPHGEFRIYWALAHMHPEFYDTESQDKAAETATATD